MAQVTMNHPPSYLGVAGPPDPASELPAYTPRLFAAVHASALGPREERVKSFEYAIKNNGKKMASMTLLAERALSKNIPTYLQGYPVKGSIYLREDKMEAVRLITVTIQGNIISGADPTKQQTFMKVKQIVWSSTDSAPSETEHEQSPSIVASAPGSTPSDTNATRGGAGALRHDVSNKGYSWDFTAHIPDKVPMPYGRQKLIGTFSPPETFNEQRARVSLVYEVCIRFSRGKLQNDFRIPVPFGYVPLTRPPPLSPLRQLAYLENVPLLGPTVDNEGWHRVEQKTLSGTLFNKRNIEMKCTLFLAKPLSYTRGSLIPLFLRLEGEDQQGCDLLSSPKVTNMQLQRRIRYHYDPINTIGTRYLRDSVDLVGHAVLWPANEEYNSPYAHVRSLNGEIHIKPGAKPTSAMGDFRVEYSILLTFEAPGFEPFEQKPLITQPVDIVTLHAPGVRPRQYAPPEYEIPETRTLFFID